MLFVVALIVVAILSMVIGFKAGVSYFWRSEKKNAAKYPRNDFMGVGKAYVEREDGEGQSGEPDPP